MPAQGGGLDHPPDNLSRQLNSFIGRHRELRDLKALLERARLLTLTGPGGSGKTRLGLQLAAELSGGFPDGVYFAALAPVGHPDLVLSSIAQGIGLRDVGDRPLLDRLRSHLEHAQVLILLDNFEHVISAAPMIGWPIRTIWSGTCAWCSGRPGHAGSSRLWDGRGLRPGVMQVALIAAAYSTGRDF